eukprot:403347900
MQDRVAHHYKWEMQQRQHYQSHRELTQHKTQKYKHHIRHWQVQQQVVQLKDQI